MAAQIEIAYDSLTKTVTERLAGNVPSSVPATLAGLATTLLTLGRRTHGETRTLRVLDGMRGVLRPGSATLILGAPGSGKSAFLRILAGRDTPDDGDAMITWNGLTAGALARERVNLTKLVAYGPQLDTHEPLLTVRETFAFIHAASAVPPPPGASPEAVAEHATRVERTIDTLGLRECADTAVGSDLVRGISGGQRKRVTIGEALLSCPRVMALDEPTNGLDSSTAAAVMRHVVTWAHDTRGTLVVAAQAPTPELVALFDDVILLSEGRELFHGPVRQVGAYLASLGFVQPAFQDTADFLCELAVSPALVAEAAAREAAERDAPAPTPLTLSVPVLAALWRHSPAGVALLGGKAPDASVTPHPGGLLQKALPAGGKGPEAPVEAAAVGGSPPAPAIGITFGSPQEARQYSGSYPLGFATYLWLLLGRQAKLMARNPAIVAAKMNQSIIMGLIIGSIFWRDVNADGAFILRISLAQYAAIFLSFSNMAEVPVVATSKKVLYGHLSSKLYPSWAAIAAVMLVHLPLALVADALFATILYWMTGYAPDAGRWAWFLFALVSHDLAMSGLFRLCAYVTPTAELGQTVAGASTGIFLTFGGFLIARPQIPPFMWPLYYFSPFSWLVRSVSVSEFNDPKYDEPIAPVPGAPSKGEAYLAVYGFQWEDAWRLCGPFVLLGYWLLFGLVCCSLVLAYVQYGPPPGTKRFHDADADGAGADAVSASRSSAYSEPAEGVELTLPPLASAPPTAPITAAPIPFTPVMLAFRDVRYTVFNPRTKATLTLLRGNTGVARPGTMTALMGASGAGKSTLLDVLAARKTTGSVSGEILVNGRPVDRATFNRISAYCEQDDVLLPTHTVGEAVSFSAALRLDPAMSPATRRAHVCSVLDLLELTPLAGRVVSSLSPAETKRASIAVELAASPSLLFLDEPTSGLDARSAAVVMRAIARVASSGRTVVCTVHQPSSELFFHFTHLHLLVPGGYDVYSGPLGHHASSLVRYLQAVPGVAPLPANTNPATWMLDVMYHATTATASTAAAAAAGSAPGAAAPEAAPPSPPGDGAEGSPVKTEAGEEEKGAVAELAPRFVLVYQRSDVYAASVAEATREGGAGKASGELLTASAAGVPFPRQLALVAERSTLDLYRNGDYMTTRVVMNSILPLFFGLLYLRVDDADQAGVLSKIAVALSNAAFAGIIQATTANPFYTRQRALFYRERAAGFYAPEAYSVSIGLVELPWIVVFTFLFNLIVYWLVGFRSTAPAFFTFLLGHFLLSVYFTYIGQLLSALLPNVTVGGILTGITISIVMLFAGVFIPVNDMPRWSAWFYYITGTAQTLRLIALPQFNCLHESSADCPRLSAVIGGGQRVLTQQAYAELRLGLPFEDRWQACGWLILIIVVFRALTVAAYRFVNWQRK